MDVQSDDAADVGAVQQQQQYVGAGAGSGGGGSDAGGDGGEDETGGGGGDIAEDDNNTNHGDLVTPTKVDVVSTKLRSWIKRHEGTLYYNELVLSVLPNLTETVDCKTYRAIAIQIYNMIATDRGGRFIKLNIEDGNDARTGHVMTYKQSVHKIFTALKTAHLKWLKIPNNIPSKTFSGQIAQAAIAEAERLSKEKASKCYGGDAAAPNRQKRRGSTTTATSPTASTSRPKKRKSDGGGSSISGESSSSPRSSNKKQKKKQQTSNRRRSSTSSNSPKDSKRKKHGRPRKSEIMDGNDDVADHHEGDHGVDFVDDGDDLGDGDRMCYHIVMEEENDDKEDTSESSSSPKRRKPKAILSYTFDLILSVCNQASIDPVIAYRILDKPMTENDENANGNETDKERRARLQLRHRYVSALAAGMSPLEFSRKLASMWGAKLIFAPKNQYPPRQNQHPPKTEEQRNQQSHANGVSGGQGHVTTSAAETTEDALAAANTPTSTTGAAGGSAPEVINGMETPSATTNANGSAEKHQLPKVTLGSDGADDTGDIAGAASSLTTTTLVVVTEPEQHLGQQDRTEQQLDEPVSSTKKNDPDAAASSTDAKGIIKGDPSASFQQSGTGEAEIEPVSTLATADSGTSA